VESAKYPERDRLTALQQIARPSMNLLRRLLSSKSTPRRLRVLATEKYSLACARRDLLKHARQNESRKDTDRSQQHA
jgi:hypothetical protein